ncbi:MAG: hypothetical protein M9936_14135 [Caldilinea sp.]|nr:hypothetical protein [Caldilinea sp.]
MTPKYTDHYETIIALVTYLAVCQRYSTTYKKTIDNATATWLADYLNLEEAEVTIVLDSFRGIFRKTKEQYDGHYRYSLLLRYSLRSYIDPNAQDSSTRLSNEELFALLDFVSRKASEEREEQRHVDNIRKQNLAMIVAVVCAVIAAASSVFVVFVR